MVQPIHYPEMYPPEDAGYHPTAAGRTLFLDKIDHNTAQMIVETLEALDASFRVTQLRVLGGAMARVPVTATAFAHRTSRILANVAAFYQGPQDRLVREAWVTQYAAALRQSDHGAYVGFLGEDGAARIGEAYPGATGDRLRQIKARYDPDNIFHLNQNILPAEAGSAVKPPTRDQRGHQTARWLFPRASPSANLRRTSRASSSTPRSWALPLVSSPPCC